MNRSLFAVIAILLLAPCGAAVAAGRYGHVEFTNSGAKAAQRDFLDGLALLHDFEYPDAAAAFKRAQVADSGFAMAYWGEAMTYTHPVWMQQDKAAALTALARLAPTPTLRRAKAKTEREKMYLDAVEALYGAGSKEERDFLFEDAMAKLHARYPDDVDATAFYGLAILGTAHAGRNVATYMRAAGLLEEAWPAHPDHPGLVHYLIHCYDDPDHAPLGLRAARVYAKIAPDAGHAQHMTSHIFLGMGMWPETVDANVAAIADVDRLRAAEDKPPLCCGHYPSWLGYAYLQLGRLDDARRALEKCRAARDAEKPEQQPSREMDPDRSLTGSYANMRLRYLIDSGDWRGDVAGWSLPANAGPGARLDFAFAGALGAVARGDTAAARGALAALEGAAREAIDAATKKADEDPTDRTRPSIFLLEAQGLFAELTGDRAGAEKLLRDAVAREETLPVAFGPPTIDKPTHELLGEFLLRNGRALEAHAEFERALARTPGRRLATRGLAAAKPS